MSDRNDFRGWMAVKDLAAMMNVSEKAVRDAVKRGEIPFHRVGGSIRFIAREVEAATAMNFAGVGAVALAAKRKAE